MAAEKEADFESIARTLGLDIEKMALKIVSAPSPTNRRQTVRKVTAPSSLGGSVLGGTVPSFNLNMMKNPLRLGRKDSQGGGYEAMNTTRSRMTAGAGFNSVKNNLAKQGMSNRTPVAVPGKITKEASGFTSALKQDS